MIIIPVTIKDIAKRCGLSVSAVSKAYNGYEDISESTKKLVLDTAKEMGYFPSSVARTLKTNRSYNLGILFMDANNAGLTHGFFMAILNSFKSVAESKGYDITFIHQNIGKTSTTFLEHCLHRKVDGVCIACLDFFAKEVKELAESSLPCVTIDHTFSTCPCVVSDNFEGLSRLTSHLIEMGHRKIAYVHGQKSSVTDKRVAAFRQTLKENGIFLPKEYLVEGHYDSAKAGGESILPLVSLSDPPTCVIMPDDISALGAIDALTKHNIRVPQDISIAGYDGTPLAQMLTPRLTTIAQDTVAMGKASANALIKKIEHKKSSHSEVISIDSTLLIGDSVKRLPTSTMYNKIMEVSP